MKKYLSWLPILLLGISIGIMGAVALLLINGLSYENLLASGVLILFSIGLSGWAARVNIERMEAAGDEYEEISGWFSG